jgi:hypothetical protein
MTNDYRRNPSSVPEEGLMLPPAEIQPGDRVNTTGGRFDWDWREVLSITRPGIRRDRPWRIVLRRYEAGSPREVELARAPHERLRVRPRGWKRPPSDYPPDPGGSW